MVFVKNSKKLRAFKNKVEVNTKLKENNLNFIYNLMKVFKVKREKILREKNRKKVLVKNFTFIIFN